jgi:hypothetical protein
VIRVGTALGLLTEVRHTARRSLAAEHVLLDSLRAEIAAPGLDAVPSGAQPASINADSLVWSWIVRPKAPGDYDVAIHFGGPSRMLSVLFGGPKG